VNLYSAFIVEPHTQDAQVQITQCYLLITPYLRLPRKHSPDGASPDWVCGRLIAAYYSFIYPRKDERLSRPGWLIYRGRFTHISGHPSSASRSQDRESSPVKDRRATTVPRNQLIVPGSRLMGLIELGVQVRASFKKHVRLVGRLGSGPRLMGRLDRKVIDCVFVWSKRGHFWGANESLWVLYMRSLRGPRAWFRFDAVRCAPMLSDAVRCGNLSCPCLWH